MYLPLSYPNCVLRMQIRKDEKSRSVLCSMYHIATLPFLSVNFAAVSRKKFPIGCTAPRHGTQEVVHEHLCECPRHLSAWHKCANMIQKNDNSNNRNTTAAKKTLRLIPAQVLSMQARMHGTKTWNKRTCSQRPLQTPASLEYLTRKCKCDEEEQQQQQQKHNSSKRDPVTYPCTGPSMQAHWSNPL